MSFPEMPGNFLSLNSLHFFLAEKITCLREQQKHIPTICDCLVQIRILFIWGRDMINVTIDTSRIIKGRISSSQNLSTNSQKHSYDLLQTQLKCIKLVSTVVSFCINRVFMLNVVHYVHNIIFFSFFIFALIWFVSLNLNRNIIYWFWA